MAKKKVKVHWRGAPGKLKHAVREVDGLHMASAVCGAKTNNEWTPPGTRSKVGDHRCSKCVTWEPMGRGPGGASYRGPLVVS